MVRIFNMNRHYFDRMQEKLDQLKKFQRPEPIRSDGAGALDLGPRDLKRDEIGRAHV